MCDKVTKTFERSYERDVDLEEWKGWQTLRRIAERMKDLVKAERRVGQGLWTGISFLSCPFFLLLLFRQCRILSRLQLFVRNAFYRSIFSSRIRISTLRFTIVFIFQNLKWSWNLRRWLRKEWEGGFGVRNKIIEPCDHSIVRGRWGENWMEECMGMDIDLIIPGTWAGRITEDVTDSIVRFRRRVQIWTGVNS